jgi:hypothetical protein
MAAPTWVAEASVTREISAPAAGWANTAEEERARLAAEKASDIAADQTNGVDPLGPPRSALVRGWTILAAAGMKRL